MLVLMGYSEEAKDIDQLPSQWEFQDRTDDGCIAISLEMQKWVIQAQWKLAGSPYDRNGFRRVNHETNAYYSVADKSIIIPDGILQPPIFVDNVPDHLNYGSLRCILSHEITHGFDPQGETFNGII